MRERRRAGKLRAAQCTRGMVQARRQCFTGPLLPGLFRCAKLCSYRTVTVCSVVNSVLKHGWMQIMLQRWALLWLMARPHVPRLFNRLVNLQQRQEAAGNQQAVVPRVQGMQHP